MPVFSPVIRRKPLPGRAARCLRQIFAAATLPILLALTACGGGGGGGGGGVELPSGRFLDSAVAGLGYSTPTLSGITDSNGRFNYRTGEMVSFYLQGLYIGQAQGAAVLTPAQLTPPPPTNANPDYSVNLLRLLQSLNTNQTPSNGITLGSWTIPQNIAQSIDLNQATDTFAASSPVTSLMAQANTTLVSAGDAMDHFASTVQTLANNSNNSGYTIDLSTRTVSSATMRVGNCPASSWTIALNVSTPTSGQPNRLGAQVISSNEIIDTSCNLINRNAAWPYTSLNQDSSLQSNGWFLPCGPVCTLADLNQTYQGFIDDNGQSFVAKVAHLAGSREILITKTVYANTNPPQAAYTASFRLILN